jgi:hypothetical protein
VTNCATHPKDVLFLWNVKFVHYFSNFASVCFCENWIWLDAARDVKFGSYASVDSKLATHGVSIFNNLCDDR